MHTWMYKPALVVSNAGLAAALLTFAAPASADDAPSMPDVTGAVLQNAVADVADVTDLPVDPSNVSGPTQVIYNYTNWIVCSESPSAGEEIAPDAEISVDVRRPATECPE